MNDCFDKFTELLFKFVFYKDKFIFYIKFDILP